MENWVRVTLPSLGQYYGDKVPEGFVEITPWTTAQEEQMVIHGSQSAKDRAKLIENLISSNVRLPEGFKYEELLSADQFFLLTRLRALSLTPHYSIDFTCPSKTCKKTTEMAFDLDALEVKTPEPDETEPFSVKLPRSGVTVSVRLMRVKDENALTNYRIQQEELGIPDAKERAYRYKLARQLDAVNGQSLKFDEKVDFIRSLVLIDLQVYKSIFTKHDVGVNMEARAACPHCGFSVPDFDVPIQLCFFNPKQSDIDAAIREAEGNRGGNDLPRVEELHVD